MGRDLRKQSIEAINKINEASYNEVNDPEILSRIAQYEMAFKMQVSVPEAMDISAEPDYIHEMYGTEPGKSSFANNCLLARRLAEKDVRFIQLYHWGWDTHERVFPASAFCQHIKLMLFEYMDELSTVLAELAEVRENLERLNDRVTRLNVVAPIEGVVHRMQVNTPGAVVEPADVLMTIVPLNEEVVIEARIQPKDIGYLQVGQEARVTVSGFDVRRYGVLPAELVQVSPTTFADETGGTYFKGRLRLGQPAIVADGVEHPIVPGMHGISGCDIT